MRFSMEIPSAYLQRWSPLTDFDFVLAHRVLEDEGYASYYAERPAGRQLILDNSMHELGHPLEVKELRKAAEIVGADFVVPPDQLGQPIWNLQQYRATRKEFAGSKHSIAAVLCGATRDDRKRYLKAVDEAAMVMLPFREVRFTWYLELENTLKRFPWIHLLGVNTLSELATFVRFSNNSDLWSVDTAKPVKAGICGRTLDGDLRGMPVSSKDLLGLKDLTDIQLHQVEVNIEHFRGICQGQIGVEG